MTHHQHHVSTCAVMPSLSSQYNGSFMQTYIKKNYELLARCGACKESWMQPVL